MRRSSFAIFHVMAVIVILVGLLTGPRLGIINHDFLAFLSPLLPQGALLLIHVLFGCLLTLIAIVFTVATIRAPFRGAPSKFDKAVNYIGYLVIVLSIATGWLLWLNPESLSLVIHGLSATGIFLYLVLHGIKHTVFKGKQVLSVLLPRNALILLSCSIALVYFCGLGIKLLLQISIYG